MSEFFTLLTDAGRAKLAAALATGVPLPFHEMALGDGNGNPVTPLSSMTALVHEVYRATLNSVTVDPANPNYIVCELLVPASAGGWSIRECGIFDADETLIAIGNFPETYKPLPSEGSARDLIIRNILAVENTNSVNLIVNTEVVTATQEWVITQITDLVAFNDGRYEPLGAVSAHNTTANPHVGKFEPLGAVAAHNTAANPHVGKFEVAGAVATHNNDPAAHGGIIIDIMTAAIRHQQSNYTNADSTTLVSTLGASGWFYLAKSGRDYSGYNGVHAFTFPVIDGASQIVLEFYSADAAAIPYFAYGLDTVDEFILVGAGSASRISDSANINSRHRMDAVPNSFATRSSVTLDVSSQTRLYIAWGDGTYGLTVPNSSTAYSASGNGILSVRIHYVFSNGDKIRFDAYFSRQLLSTAVGGNSSGNTAVTTTMTVKKAEVTA